eukprot:TRINITY_DN199_c0_g1_i4.p1 TRINITY_DN199_c0_g1~~TRINITY_DN199_c0_g1_i4.p1  ORF type:complete len:421 (-),score=59.15 TRINITY_DN199_c0_g1_i4:137-1399(-)
MARTLLLALSLMCIFVSLSSAVNQYCCIRYYTDGKGWEASCGAEGCPSPLVGFFYGFQIRQDCTFCTTLDTEEKIKAAFVNATSEFCCHDYYAATGQWDNEIATSGCPPDHECIAEGGMCLFAGFSEYRDGIDICQTPPSASETVTPVASLPEPIVIQDDNVNKDDKNDPSVADDNISFCCEYENSQSQVFWQCSNDGRAHCPPALKTGACQGSLCYLTGFTALNYSNCQGCNQPVCSAYDGDCLRCSQRGACGYCYADGTCKDYTASCPDKAGLTRNRDTCAAGPCSQYTSCGQCAKDTKCGWCVGEGGDPLHGKCLYQNSDRSAPQFGMCRSALWLGSSGACTKLEIAVDGLSPGQIAGIIFGVLAMVLIAAGLIVGWRMWLNKRGGAPGESRSLLNERTPAQEPTSPIPEVREMSAP